MDDIAKMLARGLDFVMMNSTMLSLTKSAFTNIPHPPAATAVPLSGVVPARAPDGVDRISRLPAGILRNIVSRLPVKDAARTTVLSTRWRRVWHTTPLVLVDAHLLPIASIGTSRSRLYSLGADPRNLTDAVSTVLAAHPGPFRCIYLLGTPMEMRRDELALWLQHLAAKAVQKLIFVNRARTMKTEAHLPATLFRCTSLTKLYIGFWWFPETATLPRAVAFPYLRELGLFSLVMKEEDLAFVLNRCPVLEKLVITGSPWPRLLLWEALGSGGLTDMSFKIKIGHAPMLRFLGFLVPGMYKLDIGNTVIKAQTKASPNTTVPSVQMLAVQLKLGTRFDARMLPSFLRCFPNVKTLYVQSENDDYKFWGPQSYRLALANLISISGRRQGYIECVQRHIKKVVLREFRRTRSELDFLKFIAEHAQVLEKMVLVLTHGHSPSDPIGTNLRTKLASAKWANACCELMIFQTPFHVEATAWCFLSAFDLSNPDPLTFQNVSMGH
uniref:F-box domain-containing protein n=2 Tax=Setaria italica TaxID=4555 RepID=K3YYF8_SETIT